MKFLLQWLCLISWLNLAVYGISGQITTTLKSGICLKAETATCKDINDEVLPLGGTSEIGWFYSWMRYSRFDAIPDPISDDKWKDCANNGGTPKKEFVPIIGYYPPGHKRLKKEAFNTSNYIDIVDTTYLLGFNEANRIKQDNVTPEAAANFWRKYVLPKWGPGSDNEKLLVSPSVNGCDCSDGNVEECNCISLYYSDELKWLDDFFGNFSGSDLPTQIENSGIIHMAAHAYNCNVDEAMAKLQALYDRYNLPIWVTEFACGSSSGKKYKNATKQINYLTDIIPRFESSDFIFRYSYFKHRSSDSEDQRGILTYDNWKTTDPTLNPVGVAYIQAIQDALAPTSSPTIAPSTAPLTAANIISESMQNCDTTMTWTAITDRDINTYSDVNFCYQSNYCMSTNDKCSMIRGGDSRDQQSLIYKSFDVTGKTNIQLSYDINIGPGNTFNSGQPDYIASFYSCNNLVYEITKFDHKNHGENNALFTFPLFCENSNDLTLYFFADTNDDDELALISDLELTQYYIENAVTKNICIFHDEMGSNYATNWNKEKGTIDVVSSDIVHNCILPKSSTNSCLQISEDTVLSSNDISVSGYKNIILYYDINFGDTSNPHEQNDNVYIKYYCGGGTVSIGKEYKARDHQGKYYHSEKILLDANCDDVTDLKISFETEAWGSEVLYIRNVNIFGELSEISAHNLDAELIDLLKFEQDTQRHSLSDIQKIVFTAIVNGISVGFVCLIFTAIIYCCNGCKWDGIFGSRKVTQYERVAKNN